MGIRQGMSALELVAALPQEVPRLDVLTLFSYVPSPSLAERTRGGGSGSRDEKILRRIQESVRHAPNEGRSRGVLRRQVSLGCLERIALSLPSQSVLGIRSLVTRVGELPLHLPMMDFKIKPNRKNVGLVLAALSAIGQRRGALLASGRSYHFYGFDLVDGEGLVKFLARCLLLSPMSDGRYIGHRLLSGVCTLRLTTCPQKPVVPRVVAVL